MQLNILKPWSAVWLLVCPSNHCMNQTWNFDCAAFEINTSALIFGFQWIFLGLHILILRYLCKCSYNVRSEIHPFHFSHKAISFHAEFRRKWECNGILNSNWRKNIWTSSRVLNREASQGMPKRNDVDIGGIMVACIFEQDFCLIPGIFTIL